MATRKIELNISGMTCVNCSNAIEKVTKKMEGVKEAHVSFASSKGEFLIDTAVTNEEAIVKKIEKLGYTIAVDVEALEAEKAKGLVNLKRLFMISAFCSVLLMALMFSHSFLGERSAQYVMVVAASLVQFYAGRMFYVHAYASLSNRNYDMNVLVALGTSAAYFYSLAVVLFYDNFPENLRYLYFDGSAIIITFVLLGKYLEERSKAKATNFLKNLLDLAPQSATLLLNDGTSRSVKASELNKDDVVIVKAGEKISADGVIIEGGGDIDTSMITGEPLPVYKGVNERVVAGTINQTGYLKIKVEKGSHETLLSNIIALLNQSQNQKMPIGRIADKISNIFVPSVVIIALATLCIWYFASGNTLYAILASISVLVISCPCALGLATPIAIVSSVGKGAKHGILIKNPEVLEIIKDIKYAIFDKTGTITEGKISVDEALFENDTALEILASCELKSEHPISKAVVDFVSAKNLRSHLPIDEVLIIAGKGIKATFEGKVVCIGTRAFLEEEQCVIPPRYIDFMEKAQGEAKSAILGAIDGQVVASFSLKDAIKMHAKEMVEFLKAKKIEPILLTGDQEKTAHNVARLIGIQRVYAHVLPAQKHDIIKELQKEGKVMFVGDGINDSPSIKQADIGIALSSGSDIAKEAGDIILINNDLRSIAQSINLSIATIRIIKQNLFWAFIYNAIGIPLAAGLFYPLFGLLLTPMYAGIAMSFSSVTVVLNSLRLKILKL